MVWLYEVGEFDNETLEQGFRLCCLANKPQMAEELQQRGNTDVRKGNACLFLTCEKNVIGSALWLYTIFDCYLTIYGSFIVKYGVSLKYGNG